MMTNFELDVHERCARQYEALADAIDTQIASLREVTTLSGFGGLESGEQLRRGFENTAREAVDQLRAYSASARSTARQIRAAGTGLAQHDQSLAADIRQAVQA